MYNTKNNNRYLWRSGTAHRRLLEDSGLADKIKNLSPLSDTEDKSTACISIFNNIELADQSKPCTQIYLQKISICINLQLAIRISKNHAYVTYTAPSRIFRPILRSIGRLYIEIPRKKNISTDDRRTD